MLKRIKWLLVIGVMVTGSVGFLSGAFSPCYAQITKITSHQFNLLAGRQVVGSDTLIFLSDRGGQPDLYKMGLSGGGATNLTNDTAFEIEAALSPSGDKIAYVAIGGNRNQSSLWLIDINGSNKKCIATDDGEIYGIKWSVMGDKIVYTLGMETATSWQADTWIVNIDGTITTPRFFTHCCEFDFSPDEQEIVYYQGGTNTGLFIMNVNSGTNTPLVAGGLSAWSWSPDGKWIAYAYSSAYSSMDGIFIISPTGSPSTRLSDKSAESFIWAKDSKSLFFQRGNELYKINIDNSNTTQINFPSGNLWTWYLSSDEESIFYDNLANIYRLNLTGTMSPINLTNNSLPGIVQGPKWSKDGNSLAYIRIPNSGADGISWGEGIIVVGTNGSNSREIDSTSAGGWIDTLIWSPNNDKILFSEDLNSSVLYLVDISNSQKTPLGTYCYSPDFSPGGGSITYTGSVGYKHGICVMDADGGNKRFLVEGSCPSWSPEGDKIAYMDQKWCMLEGFIGGLFSVSPMGGSPTQIASMTTWSWDIVWSPDGKTIAYTEGGNIKVVNLTTSPIMPKTVYTFDHVCCLCFSPDSQYLAFTDDVNVYTIKIDGSELTTINPPNTLAWDVDWSSQNMLVYSGIGGNESPSPGPTVKRKVVRKASLLSLQRQLQEDNNQFNSQVDIKRSSDIYVIPMETPTTQKEWTFMVYLDGDNDLEDAAINDFLEMAQVGSNDKINIVVQMDRIPGYDGSYDNWTECHRFLIQKDMRPYKGNAIGNWGDEQGGREVNMGSPTVLLDFINWAITNYPAKRYALVLWNHGSGWRAPEKEKEKEKEKPKKAVCYDNSSNDCLYMSEVKQAIESATAHLELIGFDACYMQMVETAYALRGLCDVMVASEESEPDDGWCYNTILSDLVGTPTMSPQELGRVIVTRYGQYYKSIYKYDITLSAVDMSKLNNLVTAIDTFADNMNWPATHTNWQKIAEARGTITAYGKDEDPPYHGVDIYFFADKVKSLISDTTVKDAAEQVKGSLTSAIIANYRGSQRDDNDGYGSYGLAIYFPGNLTAFNDDLQHSAYVDGNTDYPVDYVNQHQWDNFLHRFYNSAITIYGINIEPATATIEAKGTASFTAMAFNQYGDPLTEITGFVWMIVEGSGILKGSPGKTVVLETNDVVGTLILTASNTVTGIATITIIHGSVSSVSITPQLPEVEVMAGKSFIANSTNQFGHSIPASELNYMWQLISGIGGSITPTSVLATTTFTAGSRTGKVTITAETEGKRGTTAVTVTPGPIEKLIFGTPTIGILTTGMPGIMTIQTLDRFDNISPATSTIPIIVTGDNNQSKFALFSSGALWNKEGTFTVSAGMSTLSFFFKQDDTKTPVIITAKGANTSTTCSVIILPLTGSSSGTIVADDGLTKVEIGTETISGAGYIEIDASGTSTEEAVIEANEKDRLNLRINRVEGTLRKIEFHNATITTKVCVGIPYPDANDDGYVDEVSPPMRESSLKIYKLVGTGTAAIWKEIPSWPDEQNNIVYAEVSSFSFFILMGAGFEPNLEQVYVYPNPYYANKHASVGINFDRLTEYSTIKIFTIAGELVKEIHAKSPCEKWNLCNEAGERVASGIYLYLIKDPAGHKKVGKLGVIK